MSLAHILLVAVGGAMGSVCRYLVGVASLRLLGPAFPWGTLAVNIVGSFAMGAFIAVLVHRTGGTGTAVRIFATTGFLGGFTTFSAFSLDAVTLWERGQAAVAAAYVTASVGLSLAAVLAGLALVRTL